MGSDYSAVGRNEPSFRLGLSWVSLVLDVLNVAGVLDVHAVHPEEPADVEAAWDDPPAEDWPFDGPLSDEARAYFAFRSENPRQVPICKLGDNSPWIIAPEECEILASRVDDLIGGRQLLAFTELGSRVLKREGVDRANRIDTTREIISEFGQFCRECAAHDGFWAY